MTFMEAEVLIKFSDKHQLQNVEEISWLMWS